MFLSAQSLIERYATSLQALSEIAEAYYFQGKLDNAFRLWQTSEQLLTISEVGSIDQMKFLLHYGRFLVQYYLATINLLVFLMVGYQVQIIRRPLSIMDIFTISDLIAAREQSKHLYHEFLRAPSMSAGLYQLSAGSVDPQLPHTEDELYYIVQGQGQILVGTEHTSISPGSLIFVAANVEHRFYSITEDLTILVFFAPAEYSQRKDL